MDRFALDGRVAVVTGALGKLGPVWCDALLGAGARVLALDLPDAEPSVPFSELAKTHGSERLRVARADVLGRASLERALEEARAAWGVPEILVNNAGIDQPAQAAPRTYRMEDVPAAEFMRTMEVNAWGAFQCAQVFGGAMAEAGRGSIVNIGSLYASVSPDNRLYDHFPNSPPFLKPAAYGASKAALVNLTRYLATHWAARGVRVNALSPGGVLGAQDAEFRRKYESRVPMGRMATAADLAGPLVFLASDAASYVTGIELVVDGGFTAW
ncbi:MAG TPA: SDR family oxidoreductase [Candidatus Thermoplasmatota archaeon]|nr:SDR family oxidoreductase [Candidatus Thermoplasmatota archaeon]